MGARLAALALALAALGGQASAAVTRINVAPSGDDTGDGSAARPVRTLARAQALLRASRARGAGEVDVVLAAGFYPLARPLDLGPAESGQPSAPTVFRAAPGAAVELGGGGALTGWRPAAGGEIVAGFDPAATGGRCPAQLYVNGQRRERPRFPATGAFRAGAPGGDTLLFAGANDLPSSFRPGPGAEIVVIDAWVGARLPLAGYAAATRRLVLGAPFRGHKATTAIAAGSPYWIENAAVARLAPGQWQCDPGSRTIRYRLLSGEAANRVFAIAPGLTQLVRIVGGHDIRFEDIGFAYTGWTMPAGGWLMSQSEVKLPAAVEATQCARLAFKRVRVHATGASGLRVGAGCRDVEVADGDFTDLGGGGLLIGPDDRGTPSMPARYTKPGPDRVTSNVRVTGNTVAHLGRVLPGAAGIWQGQADHVTIAGNQVSDLYYTGISVGWVWNSSPGVARDNRVVGNSISNYGQGLMSDMGGIYTLGAQPNTLIADNQVSGGRAAVYGGWGLYADEGSSGITFRNNLVRNTSDAALFAHVVGQVTFARNIGSNVGENGIRCSPPRSDTLVMFADNRIGGADMAAVRRACSLPNYRFAGT